MNHEHIKNTLSDFFPMWFKPRKRPKSAKVSKKLLESFEIPNSTGHSSKKKIRLKQNQMKGLLKHRSFSLGIFAANFELKGSSNYQVTLLGSKEDFFQLWVELPANKNQDWNSFHKDTAELGRYVDISCQCMTCGTSNWKTSLDWIK